VVKKVVDIRDIAQADVLASTIANLWQSWKSSRVEWERSVAEVREYIFATDTTKTSNSTLPWKNSTTTPKLCQIRDNLHANYMASLFPTDIFFNWIGEDRESVKKKKVDAIKAYMVAKLRQSDFQTEVSRCVYDFIDYGNVFAEVVFTDETHELPDGSIVSVYQGPKLQRISPYDIMFDITAPSFKDAPKIMRRYLSLGQLEEILQTTPNAEYAKAAIDKVTALRTDLANYSQDQIKTESISFDGFGSIQAYLTSGLVELLEFEGDLYDSETDTLYRNRRIIVMDKMFVLSNEPLVSWLGKSNKIHVGWRLRPDNLMAQGPLDNLVGLQYRIDHLENLKADVFDQIATPVVYQKGYVEDWSWGPGQRIFGDTESDVKVLSPDTTALNADLQIAQYMNLMEELAGAPKQAMGIRTPGEKTAYEVSSLENAAGRIYQSKVQYFEKVFIEDALNQMLVAGRQNVRPDDIIRTQDNESGIIDFLQLTQADLSAKGRLVPVGARHFAKQAQIVQNLTNLSNSSVYQDPAVNVHISGQKMAELLVDSINLGSGADSLVEPHVRLYETAEAQRVQNVITTQVGQEAGMDSQVLDETINGEENPLPTDAEELA
jgi:hypothetical protein